MQTVSRRSLSLASLVAMIAIPACGAEPKESPELGTGDRARRIQPIQWERRWTAGGSESDTTLLQPWRLAVGDSLVFVADKAGNRVAAFRSADGALAWIRGGRGAGPGEFQLPTSLAVTRSGDLWVADARNARITVYAPDGKLLKMIPLPDVPYTEAMCPLADGGVLLAAATQTQPLIRLSADGDVVSRADLPWADLRGAPSLSTQKVLASTGSGCVLALALGRGFALLRGDGVQIHPYVESFALPAVTKHTEDGGNSVVARVQDMRVAANSVAYGEGEIAVAVGGPGRLANRLIDLYSGASGEYLLSLETPIPINEMVRSGGTFYFLTYGNGYPAIVAVRPRTRSTQPEESPAR